MMLLRKLLRIQEKRKRPLGTESEEELIKLAMLANPAQTPLLRRNNAQKAGLSAHYLY